MAGGRAPADAAAHYQRGVFVLLSFHSENTSLTCVSRGGKVDEPNFRLLKSTSTRANLILHLKGARCEGVTFSSAS